MSSSSTPCLLALEAITGSGAITTRYLVERGIASYLGVSIEPGGEHLSGVMPLPCSTRGSNRRDDRDDSRGRRRRPRTSTAPVPPTGGRGGAGSRCSASRTPAGFAPGRVGRGPGDGPGTPDEREGCIYSDRPRVTSGFPSR